MGITIHPLERRTRSIGLTARCVEHRYPTPHPARVISLSLSGLLLGLFIQFVCAEPSPPATECDGHACRPGGAYRSAYSARAHAVGTGDKVFLRSSLLFNHILAQTTKPETVEILSYSHVRWLFFWLTR